MTNRLFAAGPRAGLRAHLASYGQLPPESQGPHLVPELERAGLIGRGGAGFAASRKFAAAVARRPHGPRPVVIGNGAEGEPRSVKDARLLTDAPHLVVDGLLAAGAAVGAGRLYLYVSPPGLDRVRSALAERRDARRVRLIEAPETFISGEASAVVRAIETGTALPADRVGHLTESGLKGRPTLVHNVETLAHVALIARFGAPWFRSVGTADDPGTRLVTISGAVAREGVLEVDGAATLREIVRAAGPESDPAAVLVGGYHGAWVPGSHLDTRFSPSGLSPFGAHPGAGVVFVLSRRSCGLHETAQIIRYLADSSAGQCGPCRFGLPQLAASFDAIAYGSRDPGLAGRAPRLADEVIGRGACRHPDGTVRLVRSALSVFADDVAAHRSGRCLRGL